MARNGDRDGGLMRLAPLAVLLGIVALVVGCNTGSRGRGAGVPASVRGSGEVVVDSPPPAPGVQADPARGTVDVTIRGQDGAIVVRYQSDASTEARTTSPPCTYLTTSTRMGQAQVDPQTNEIRGSGRHTVTTEPVDGDASCPQPSNPEQTLPDDQVRGQIDADTGRVTFTATGGTSSGPIVANFDATVPPEQLEELIEEVVA